MKPGEVGRRFPKSLDMEIDMPGGYKITMLRMVTVVTDELANVRV